MNGDATTASDFTHSTGDHPSATEKSYEEHSEIMDAVMNLAQATNAQTEAEQLSVPTDPAFDTIGGDQSKKRKATSPPSADAPGSPDHSKMGEQALNDMLAGSNANESDMVAHDGNITANDESHLNLGDQTGDMSGTDAETSQQVLLARNGRPLNTSKRAAQNRAAQRAFRARRDEYVRQVEERAKQLEDAQTHAQVYRERFDAALQLIQNLRADAQSLRSSLSSVSDRAPDVVNSTLEEIKERPMEDFELNPHLMPKSDTPIADEGSQQHNLNELSAVAAAAASAAASSAESAAQA